MKGLRPSVGGEFMFPYVCLFPLGRMGNRADDKAAVISRFTQLDEATPATLIVQWLPVARHEFSDNTPLMVLCTHITSTSLHVL